jgi:AraC family transcriptional regulator
LSGDVTKPISHVATHDPRAGAAISIADDSTLAWSSGARWSGVVVELRRFEYLDTPSFQPRQHMVALHRVSSSRIDVELDETRASYPTSDGVVSLIPAGVRCRLRLQCGALLVVALAPALVEQSCAAVRLEAHAALDDPQIVRIAMALEAEACAGYPSGRVYGESMATALGAHLATRYARDDPTRVYSRGLTTHRLRCVLDYIDDNLSADVCLVALARVAGLSQHRFAHNFKRATGLPPHQFVMRRRIELAKPMLRDTNDSITEVTYALGFGSPSRFTHLFRRETGLTPSHYRASFRDVARD